MQRRHVTKADAKKILDAANYLVKNPERWTQYDFCQYPMITEETALGPRWTRNQEASPEECHYCVVGYANRDEVFQNPHKAEMVDKYESEDGLTNLLDTVFLANDDAGDVHEMKKDVRQALANLVTEDTRKALRLPKPDKD